MAKGKKAAQWRKFTRADLGSFDSVATSVVLYAMERGGVARMSSNHHVIVRAPNGGTMSVPTSGNKSQQVLELTVRKLFPDEPNELSVPAQRAPEIVAPDILRPTLECPRPDCDAVFVTEGARYSHIDTVHVRCRVPGCGYPARNASGEQAHYRIVHLDMPPRRGHRKASAGTQDTSAETRPAASVDDHTQDAVEPPRSTPTVDPEVTRLRQRVDALEREVADLVEIVRNVRKAFDR